MERAGRLLRSPLCRACGSYGRSINRMEGRQGAWGAPRVADLPLCPLSWLSPVPLLMPQPRQPDGRRAAFCLQGQAWLWDGKMRAEGKALPAVPCT